MAEVYLASLVHKNLALARQLSDVVSAGISEISPEQKLNPRKLKRLFTNHDILNSWAQNSERLLLPEDVVDFTYILLLNNANPEEPYVKWAEENPNEAEAIKTMAKEDQDWKKSFSTKVLDLSAFGESEKLGRPHLDPVQPGGGVFGVRMAKFEKAFADIKDSVNGFLLKELKFTVEGMRFLKTNRHNTVDGAVQSISKA
jgi:hypothetical protein